MRCPRCNEEVLLAKTCPYCGADVAPAAGPNELGTGGRYRKMETDERRANTFDGAERRAADGRGARRAGQASGASRRAEGHRGAFRGRIGRGAAGDRADSGGRWRGPAYDAAGRGQGASLGDVWRFFTSDKVATWKKFSPLLLLFYFLSPLDFVPDVIPLFGWFDDATIAVVAWRWLANEIAKHGMK